MGAGCRTRSLLLCLRCFFEHCLVDERKDVAVKTVFTCVSACDQDDEAHQDVSRVMAHSTGKHEAEVHHKSEEHSRASEAAENQAKADKEFTPRNQDIEQFDIRNGEGVQEVNIPAIDDSVRTGDRVGCGAFQEAGSVKSSSDFVVAGSQPGIPEIDPKDGKKSGSNFVFS